MLILCLESVGSQTTPNGPKDHSSKENQRALNWLSVEEKRKTEGKIFLLEEL